MDKTLDNNFGNSFSLWLTELLSSMPKTIRLVYIEWNTGYIGKKESYFLNPFGYPYLTAIKP
jgi:hypothetical protein